MRDRLAATVTSVLASKAARAVRSWLGLKAPSRANHELAGVSVPAEVVVYFGDIAAKNYQLIQWIPVLERLHTEHPVILVFRKVGALREMKRQTNLPMIFVRRFEDMMSLYDANNYRVCLYVNNGVSNFQSLSHARMVHVHINHGESDKVSMVSNQVKAYDKVLIAGPAATERHKSVLIDFDESKLVTVGRPQLDIQFPSGIPSFSGQTIMYAPTWEGENSANNYTSLDVYGLQIVNALLASGSRVVYKPHPRVSDSNDPAVQQAHMAIIQKINESNERDNVHIISETGNILGMFEKVDALITDVSSVGLDFLYLHSERPLIITDRRNDKLSLERDAPVSRACHVINGDSVSEILSGIGTLIEQDGLAEKRLEMRNFYFGQLVRGESTEAFMREIDSFVRGRNEKLKSYRFHETSYEASDE